MDEQKRRYSAAPDVVRIHAGGEYDEWFDCRDRVTYGDFVQSVQGKTALSAALSLAERMIVDWSLTDAAGQKLPITADTVAGLEYELAEPVLTWIAARPFFGRMLRRKNLESSPPSPEAPVSSATPQS